MRMFVATVPYLASALQHLYALDSCKPLSVRLDYDVLTFACSSFCVVSDIVFPFYSGTDV